MSVCLKKKEKKILKRSYWESYLYNKRLASFLEFQSKRLQYCPQITSRLSLYTYKVKCETGTAALWRCTAYCLCQNAFQPQTLISRQSPQFITQSTSVGTAGCVVHVLLRSSSSDKWLFEAHTVCTLWVPCWKGSCGLSRLNLERLSLVPGSSLCLCETLKRFLSAAPTETDPVRFVHGPWRAPPGLGRWETPRPCVRVGGF